MHGLQTEVDRDHIAAPAAHGERRHRLGSAVEMHRSEQRLARPRRCIALIVRPIDAAAELVAGEAAEMRLFAACSVDVARIDDGGRELHQPVQLDADRLGGRGVAAVDQPHDRLHLAGHRVGKAIDARGGAGGFGRQAARRRIDALLIDQKGLQRTARQHGQRHHRTDGDGIGAKQAPRQRCHVGSVVIALARRSAPPHA